MLGTASAWHSDVAAAASRSKPANRAEIGFVLCAIGDGLQLTVFTVNDSKEAGRFVLRAGSRVFNHDSNSAFVMSSG